MSLGRKIRLVCVCVAASNNAPAAGMHRPARRPVQHRTGLSGFPGASTPFTFQTAID